jgi:hypothetical protein
MVHRRSASVLEDRRQTARLNLIVLSAPSTPVPVKLFPAQISNLTMSSTITVEHTVEHPVDTVYNVLLSSTAAPTVANAHNLKFSKQSVKGLHDQRVSPR